MSLILKYIVTGIVAYLLGSVSTGILVSQATNGPDLRSVGSHNTGATNALRVMGLKRGLITFIGDVSKACLSCWIGWLLTGVVYGAMLAGLMVVIGHNWPCFFQFRGGKGVASSCGAMVMCFPVPALIAFAIGILTVLLTRFVSLASMLVAISFAVIVSCMKPGDPWIIAWSVLLGILCLYRHRENIVRLIHGNENKLGKK